MAANSSLDDFLEQAREDVNATLDRLVPQSGGFGGRLHEAMRYSLFSGGKRLRPCLCLMVHGGLAGAFGETGYYAPALPFGCALEMIHTYSLIHDDLPAMDDDDLRRGRPSCHKAFDEATAILAGDGLLTLAFQAAAEADGVDPVRMTRIIGSLARAAGPEGMVLGQMRDLISEQKNDKGPSVVDDLTRLQAIHATKTAAMISACFEIGALAAGAGDGEISRLAQAGTHVGLAFQIIDDILDVVATTEQLGKTAGKDAAGGKATYPAAIGLDASRQEAAVQTNAALKLLPEGADFDLLRDLVDRMLTRTH